MSIARFFSAMHRVSRGSIVDHHVHRRVGRSSE